jgi:hypothetical protein
MDTSSGTVRAEKADAYILWNDIDALSAKLPLPKYLVTYLLTDQAAPAEAS